MEENELNIVQKTVEEAKEETNKGPSNEKKATGKILNFFLI